MLFYKNLQIPKIEESLSSDDAYTSVEVLLANEEHLLFYKGRTYSWGTLKIALKRWTNGLDYVNIIFLKRLSSLSQPLWYAKF